MSVPDPGTTEWVPLSGQGPPGDPAAIPARLGEVAKVVTDFNDPEAAKSGWYQLPDYGDTPQHAPNYGNWLVQTLRAEGWTEFNPGVIQLAYKLGSSGSIGYFRTYDYGSWNAWKILNDIPTRLSSYTSSTLSNLDSGTQSGWHDVDAAATGRPAGIAAGTQIVFVIAYSSSSSVFQRIWERTTGRSWERFRNSSGVWSTWSLISSATTPLIEISLRSPQQATGAGNVFPNIVALTAYEKWHWEFANADGKIWGQFEIPSNAVISAQEIILDLTFSVITGNVRFNVKTKRVADGESMNPASLVAITSQDITVPGTARNRKKVTFVQAGETWLPGDIVLVEIMREGAHANDTHTGNAELDLANARIA